MILTILLLLAVFGVITFFLIMGGTVLLFLPDLIILGIIIAFIWNKVFK